MAARKALCVQECVMLITVKDLKVVDAALNSASVGRRTLNCVGRSMSEEFSFGGAQ